MPPADPDHAIRLAALEEVRDLSRVFQQLVPRDVLLEGFEFEGARISYGSFQRGIHRSSRQSGPGALTVTTTPPVPGKVPPYDDGLDEQTGTFLYHYRTGSPDIADNRALRAAAELQAPLIYFKGIAPGQYMPIAPVFAIDQPAEHLVQLAKGLPHQDTAGEGMVSSEIVRRYEFREVRRRMHQVQFRRDVLYAYRDRCAICSLNQPDLLEASHIVRDADERGIAAIVNGLALCAIHHRAYDRNLVGIDPRGKVHLSQRLLREVDGPMLGNGLQHFHGAEILQPRRTEDRPDPDLLELRFSQFESAET